MLLRGELAAIHTYAQAIERMYTSTIRTELADCRGSHARRVELLRNYIQAADGEDVVEGAEVWSDVANLLVGDTGRFGHQSIVDAIEQGEQRMRDVYRRELGELTADVARFVSERLLPEQERTLATLARLQKQL